MWPIENFGVVPVFTSVTLSRSPALARISTMENFIVSLATISMARPSFAAGAVAAAIGVAVGRSPTDGCGPLQAAAVAPRSRMVRSACGFMMRPA